ncbi:MAG: saccharopine dehydrogenase NADP-binding domain-containing protein [Bacteroidaceae bacterium]|nr:saccharopine dehydrogenase NADP-binding domain-containing protein [Bacteroidaceae bacterium]
MPSDKTCIGIIGGTGRVGTLIVDYLLNQQDCPEILVGGRTSPDKTQILNKYSDKPLRYYCFDYNNENDLDAFCSQCVIIINTAGPSYMINDKIALAALKNKSHYIDVGGYGRLYKMLEPYDNTIKSQNLCFIIGAGWMPGLSGVFSKSIIEKYSNEYDATIFKIYYGAVDNWSYNSSYDLAVSSMEDTRPYKYSYGEIQQVSAATCTSNKTFPFIGYKKICVPSFDEQLSLVAKSLKHVKEISSYVMVNDFLSMCKYMFIKTFYKHRLDKAAFMLHKDYIRLVNKENRWGSVICRVLLRGKTERIHYLYTNNNLLYTAVPAVVATNYILNDKMKVGLNCLCDSVNCNSFMADVEQYGIKQFSYV